MSTLRAWLLALLLAAAVFAAIAPTLAWPEFTGGNENIVTQTALEMRRAGPVFSKGWLVPTMLGEPRVKKPPLVAWITALAIRPATMAQLDNPRTREAAYRALAWQVRWTGLFAGCVMVLATFELGRVIGGSAAGSYVGFCSAAAVATNLLFVKFMRQSTSDVHLAMWVTIANAAFVHGLLRGRWWIAATLGAGATGMAFLCKGPVALLETALPLAVGFLSLSLGERLGEGPERRFAMSGERAKSSDSIQMLRSGQDAPLRIPSPNLSRGRGTRIATGVAIFLSIALPWFVHVYCTVPGVWHTWFSEVSRQGASTLEADSPLTYFQIIPDFWPWLVFGVIGVMALRTDRRLWLAAMQIVLPLLVMVWVKDRKDRYLLPMIAPAAVLCGAGVVAWWRARRSVAAWPRWVTMIHVISLVGGSIVFIIAGTRMTTARGTPWFAPQLAAWAVTALLSLTGLWWIAQRRWPGSVIVFTTIIMLMLQALFMFGYSQTDHGKSPFKAMADQILALGPNVPVHDWLRKDRRVDEGLGIYLDRTIIQCEPQNVTGKAVMILRQLPSETPPTLPPPWRVLTKATERRMTWWAFAREE